MEYFNLTTPQKNIWNLQKYYSDTAIANLCGATFYSERRDSVYMQQAIWEFIQNQSGIRLRFCGGEEPKQYVSDEINEDIPVMIFSSMKEFDSYVEKFAGEPLGLTGRFLYRFVVFHVENRSGILVLLSHLISDAWTFGLLAKQLDEAYHRLAGDTENAENISLLKADYVNYINSEKDYMSSERYAKDRKYWKEKYADCPQESLMKLQSVSTSSITAKRITRELSFSLEQRTDKFCRANSVTHAVLFEAALIIYLHRIHSENMPITIGVPVLNRSNAREKEIAGMFVSTMPLTVTISADMTVMELAKQITREHMNIFRHQKYPYADILRFLREKHKISGNLYGAMVSYQNAKTDTQAYTKWYSNGYSEVPFILHIDNRDGNNSHTLNVDYQTALFQEEEVEYIIKRLEYILGQITESGDRSIKDIDILPEQEWKKVVCEFNDTYAEYPEDKCVHELFMEQVEKTPDEIALVFEDKKFTYRQLDEMSNSLAHFLREGGVKRNDVVPIIAKRSWHVIVAMLGVLKAGGAYMPVSPDYPEDRIACMIETAKSKVALLYGYGESIKIEGIKLEDFDFAYGESTIENVNKPEDSAYIISTSGSTGMPKGITASHCNVCNYVQKNRHNCVCYVLAQNQYSSVVSVTNIIFDIFITESILPLVNGMRIYMASDEEATSQDKLSKLIAKNHLNVLQTTPTKMKSYLVDRENIGYLRTLKAIILGGEAFPRELYKELRKYTDAKIYNIYGPAETTVWSSNTEVTDEDITIGKPIANTQIYILGSGGNPLPIGIVGELCIAGAGVGKGYLNCPELTAERFVPNPFATAENRHGKILYHTGDLARWRADGELEYLGRIDTQVKIRGLRIELGEIESVLGTLEGMELTAVTDKTDEDGRQYLVGYYTGKEEVEEKKIRKHLAEKLPGYMIPNYFMHLEHMPMTPSGKIDRKNLPTPDYTVSKKDYIAPVTDTEKRLADLWQKLLHIENVGKTDDFYESGGDSLLAISMLNEIGKEFGAEISIKDILEHSTLEQLALCIDQSPESRRLKIFHDEKYILLPQQKAIFAVYSKNPNTLTYNMPARIHLPETIDRDKLKQSIHHVIDSHKILKSHIRMEEDDVYGIYDENNSVSFEEYRNGSEAAFIRPFRLEEEPPVRVGFTEDSLLFDMHHIAADGTSLNIILRDILDAYEGKEVRKFGAEYSDYARYFYELDTSEYKRYFVEMLKCDFEPVLFPESKNPKQGGRSKLYHIPEKVFRKAKEYAEKNGLTDTMVFLGAYGILLSKYTSGKDILTSIVLQNRTQMGTSDMVGMFVNTLPLYLAVKGNTKDYMQTVKQILLNLFRYQELPFSEIADAVGMKDKSVVNTSFVYQGDGEKVLYLDGQELVPEYMNTHTAKFDFCMELTPLRDACRIRMEYNLARYDELLMDKLADAYLLILSQLEKERIADISILTENEYHRVIEEFNDTYVEYPRNQCIHELFMEQAEQTSDKIALIFENKRFTYRELDEMSNSLAHFLREKGVKPNEVVPIIAKRSWHVIVAMLGVLKAGGAYMPIDPAYPEDRIAYMIKDVNAEIVLQYGYTNTLPGEVISLKSFNFKCNAEKIAYVNKSKDACYVLYTSGTTGKPKGIEIQHYNLVNFVYQNEKNAYQSYAIRNGNTMLASTVFTFDISVFEIFMSLLNGISVILVNDDEMQSTHSIAKLIQQNSIDILQCTPTKIRMLLGDDRFRAVLKSIKVIMLGAEELTSDLCNELFAYTDSAVFNGYGPTETTIGVSFKKIDNDDITIGTPIANTQIYILDSDQNPYPIGVAGELCIAGEGVGKGYLNRPELTAERFVPNPFATEANHHGKVMYRTGDLARWREDGEIEYLGRIDTQVKIRGLRIELGEIESVMGTMEGIELTAVAEKRDEDNRQYLVGYYTAKEEIDEKKLREHLARQLPRYMIPNFFMRLTAMPMTPSGKTDRKNLPTPILSGQAEEYVAPVTVNEKALCHLLEELLHMERIGITDDFFDNGGDSLTAIEYTAKAHSLGIDFALQNVFDYPTVQLLCDFLEKGKASRISYKASDFGKYQKLFEGNKIEESFVPEKKSLGNILLTGATGFLGAHVLDALLREEEGKIYCLVRSSEKESAQERMQRLLKHYFGNRYDTELGRRILLIEGDIERKELADHMPEDVQTVIHTAASVSHYGSYEYFHRVNVEGTQHIVHYAKRTGARLIHISTLSVSGNSMADDFTAYRSEEEKFFDETSLYIGQPLDNVYTHSKFEAEMAVYDAMLDGLDAKVIRVGNLTNRASDYKFQPNYRQNAFLTRVKAMLEFGFFPDYLMPLYSEFSPIDLTAEGIVKIAQYAREQCVFHLNSNRPIYFDRMLEVLKELGISMKVVDGAEFGRALEQTIRNVGTEYIFEALQNDRDKQGRLVYDSNIRIVNDFTVWFLKKVGFEWNEIDREYMSGYINYFRELGYLEV